MNKIQAILVFIAILTLPLITLFIPDSEPGTLSTLEGVTLTNMQGQKFRFSAQFADKPILLAFWSVTCKTCLDEIPFLIKLHEEHHNRLTIMGIHPPGHPAAHMRRFMAKYGSKIPYMLAVDDEMKLINTFKVTVLPRTLLINRQGKVLYDHLGYDPDSDKEIENAILSKL